MKSLEIVDERIENAQNRNGLCFITIEELETIKQDLEDYQKVKSILKKKMKFNSQPVSHREEEQFTFCCKGLLSKKDKKFLESLIEDKDQ